MQDALQILQLMLAGQALVTAFLSVLFWALYARLRRQPFLWWWAWAWTAFGVYLVAGSLAVLMIGTPSSEPLRHAFTAVSSFAGWLQAPALILGALHGASRFAVSRRLITLLFVGAGVGATFVYVISLFAGGGFEASLIRGVPRNTAVAAAYLGCAVLFWSDGTRRRSAAARVTAIACSIWGLSQLVYATGGLNRYLVLTMGADLGPLAGAVGIDPRWVFVDVTCELGIAVGLVLLLLENHRELERDRDLLLVREQAARLKSELAERRAAFLADAGAALGATLAPDDILAAVVEAPVPILADVCHVEMSVESLASRIACATPDPARRALVEQLASGRHVDFAGIDGADEIGEPLLVPDVTDAFLARIARGDEGLDLLRRLAPTSIVHTALEAHGRRLGTMTLMMCDSGRRHSAADATLAAELARRAALATDHAVLFAEARHASRLKDEFLTIVSHELRTPVTSILGRAQWLRRRAGEDEVLRRGLDEIEHNSRVQVGLINDLLDVSRIVSGTMRLDMQTLDLRGVVSAAVRTVGSTAEQKGVRLGIDAPGDPVTVVGDASRLEQVVWNLLANAIKFTPEGGSVRVELGHGAARAWVRVRDTGVGIGPEFLPHVFERFRQADGSETRAHGGLGLGLAIVKNLAELHDGTVWAESSGPGEGATFTVELPLSRSTGALARTEQV